MHNIRMVYPANPSKAPSRQIQVGFEININGAKIMKRLPILDDDILP